MTCLCYAARRVGGGRAPSHWLLGCGSAPPARSVRRGAAGPGRRRARGWRGPSGIVGVVSTVGLAAALPSTGLPSPVPPGLRRGTAGGAPRSREGEAACPPPGAPGERPTPPSRGRMERLRPVGGRLPPFEGDPRGVLGSPGRLHCTGLFRAFFALVTSHALSESEFSSRFVWEQREESPVFPDVNFCRL